MGIADFGNKNSKIVEGNITYTSEGYNLHRCSQCKNSTIYSYGVKNKDTKDIINNLKEDELYCFKYKRVVTKWNQCFGVNAPGFEKREKKVKGWLYGWIEQEGNSESFKDIVSDKDSITTSIHLYDSKNNLCYLKDVVISEDNENFGVIVHDYKTGKDIIISLLHYPLFQKSLTKTDEIPLFQTKGGFEVISSLYEIEKIEKKSISDFVLDIRSKGKSKKKKV